MDEILAKSVVNCGTSFCLTKCVSSFFLLISAYGMKASLQGQMESFASIIIFKVDCFFGSTFVA